MIPVLEVGGAIGVKRHARQRNLELKLAADCRYRSLHEFSAKPLGSESITGRVDPCRRVHDDGVDARPGAVDVASVSRRHRAARGADRRSAGAVGQHSQLGSFAIWLRPRGHMDSPKGGLSTCPPGSTTTSYCECWFPHETTKGPSHLPGVQVLAGRVRSSQAETARWTASSDSPSRGSQRSSSTPAISCSSLSSSMASINDCGAFVRR